MYKPDLFSDIHSIPGISDHEIILADCDLKPVVCKKPPQTIYLWNKVDWNKIRLLTSEFSESFLPEHGTRSVEKNYTMFKEFIDRFNHEGAHSQQANLNSHQPTVVQ